MKEKNISKMLRIPIFEQNIFLTVTNAQTFCFKNTGEQLPLGIGRTTFSNTSSGALIEMILNPWRHKNNKISAGEIAHEAYHAAIFILQWVDAEPKTRDEGGNETIAYLMGYITNQITKTFRQNGISDLITFG